MFQKVQENLQRRGNEWQQRKLTKKKERLERAAEQAAYEQAQLEEEKTAILKERERLLSLDEKALMVEMILAMRGLYATIKDIEKQQEVLTGNIEDMESDIYRLENDLLELKQRVDAFGGE